jgi:hypothetical protein
LNLTSAALILVIGIATDPVAASAGTLSAAKVPKTALAKGTCIELSGYGLPRTAPINSLVGAALLDSAPGIDMGRFGHRPLKFYKARPVIGSSNVYLVFSISGFDDVYMVYVGSPTRGHLVSRSTYGSFHYPCVAPKSERRSGV